MIEKKVSIVVPIYKVEAYLERCINSILNQTYQNLEVILVDDGSPDNCPAICDHFANIDPRVKVVHKENGGLSDARNVGMKYVTGEYIGFIDSDDFISNKMFEILVKRLTEDDSDMACCNYVHVDEAGTSLNKASHTYPIKDECVNKEGAYDNLILYGGYYGIIWNKLYRRNVLSGIQFPLGRKYEDTFVIHEIIWNCNKISHIKEPLYYYVQRSKSIMAESFSIKSLDYGDAMIQLYHFGKKHHIDSLKHYAANRLSYKFDEWKELVRNDEKSLVKYKELKKKSKFLLTDSGAWKYANIKGKLISKIQFLFS